MSWQSKVLALVKKYGESAKFAASTILNAVIPGSPIVIALIEQAFDSAQKTAQDDWELNLSNQVQTTAENQARLEQMLDILGGDLQHLFAQVAGFEKMPEIAKKLVEISQQSDARLREAVKKLDGVAHRFDHLEELTTQVLTGQHTTHGKLDEISASVRKLMSPRASYESAIVALVDHYMDNLPEILMISEDHSTHPSESTAFRLLPENSPAEPWSSGTGPDTITLRCRIEAQELQKEIRLLSSQFGQNTVSPATMQSNASLFAASETYTVKRFMFPAMVAEAKYAEAIYKPYHQAVARIIQRIRSNREQIVISLLSA